MRGILRPGPELGVMNHSTGQTPVTLNNDLSNDVGNNESLQYQRLLSPRVCTDIPSHSVNNKTNASTISAYDQEDLHDIIDTAIEAFPLELLRHDVDETHPLPIRIEGGKDFVMAQQNLLEEYRNVFRSTINPKAVRIESFTLEVDKTQ